MRYEIYSRTFLAGAMILAFFSGCNPPPRPALSEISAASVPKLDEASALAQASANDIGDGISLGELKLPWETWHRYYIGGKPVGYLHAQSEIDQEGGEGNARTTLVDHLTLRRGSSTLVQLLRQTSIEARDGSLVSFDAELRVGPTRTKFDGRVVIDSLTVSTMRGTERQTETLPWSNRYRGIAALQQTLLAKPIKQNETRRLRFLVPVSYRMGSIDLKCQHRASITTMDGKVHDALEIEVRTSIGEGAAIESTVWCDEQGDILKSYIPALDLTTIRSSESDATKVIESPADVISVTSIAVSGSLTNPKDTFRAGYVLKSKSHKSGPAEISIEPQVGQWFRKIDDKTIQLLVSRDPKETGREGFTGLKSTPELADSESGPIIDSVSPDVKKLAGLSQAKASRELALDLTRTVKQLIAPGDFTRGFATASQTARDGMGDCTERAVLLAAMLRSREIPSRVVAGLVYAGSTDKPLMAYHMWTIAWIDNQWLALDPTSGGIAAADRIAFASSNLADGNEYKCLSPILNAVGRLEIEIASAKYQPLE